MGNIVVLNMKSYVSQMVAIFCLENSWSFHNILHDLTKFQVFSKFKLMYMNSFKWANEAANIKIVSA